LTTEHIDRCEWRVRAWARSVLTVLRYREAASGKSRTTSTMPELCGA